MGRDQGNVGCDERSVAVRSRPGRICTDQFPELQELGDVLRACRVVLDGELVCLGTDGKPDFAALRCRLGVRDSRPAAAQRPNQDRLMIRSTFCTWTDELSANATTGADENMPAELALDRPAWRTPRQFVGEDEALLKMTNEQGLEGVVAKRLDAPLHAGSTQLGMGQTQAPAP